jgi:hypothetical protein
VRTPTDDGENVLDVSAQQRARDPSGVFAGSATSCGAPPVAQYAETLGTADPTVLDWRDAHANWTAEAGNIAAALCLRRDLVDDMERAQSPREDIIGARYRLAALTTKAGQFAVGLNARSLTMPPCGS